MLLPIHTGFFANCLATAIRIFLLICLIVNPAHSEENLEYKIKAAYLYNFTKFITWPETTLPSFNICLVGIDPFNELLDSLETKQALGKPIRIFRYHNIKQVRDCHIVYFSNIDAPSPTTLPLTLLVGSLDNSLTVSSQSFFAESGGMIGFVLEEDKVRLHINLKALKKSGLGISAKLIEVSTLVEGNQHE